MNKQFQKALQEAFEAPPPMDKTRFLKTLPYPKIIYRDFLLFQLHYIRKRIWVFSTLILFMGWLSAFYIPMIIHWNPEEVKIWGVSSLVPFLAMITITEIYRSTAYRMAELEESCRFSLPQIIMARITILGAVNFSVLTFLLIFINQVSSYSLLQIILYLMVPYFIVSGICLWILNHVRSQEGVYSCAVAACLVSVINVLCKNTAFVLYTHAYLNGWLALFVFCFIFFGIQIRELIKQTEEKQWNLSLTE